MYAQDATREKSSSYYATDVYVCVYNTRTNFNIMNFSFIKETFLFYMLILIAN